MDFSHIDEGHTEGEEPVRFFYSRDERLKNAPEIVREYYSGRGPRPVKGLFKALTSTRGNRFMLMSVIFFAAFVWIFAALTGTDDSTVGEIQMQLTAFSYEESIYASLKLLAGKRESEVPCMVNAVFTAIDADGQTVDTAEEEDIYYGKEMFLRTKFRDYDIIKVSADVKVGEESKTLNVNVERH